MHHSHQARGGDVMAVHALLEQKAWLRAQPRDHKLNAQGHEGRVHPDPMATSTWGSAA